MTELLSPSEQLAFAGLVRVLLRLDGRFSDDERAALPDVARALLAHAAPVVSPYRQDAAPDDPSEDERLWDLLDRAATELPDDDAVRRAATAVTRVEAREAIYAALHDLAAADSITPAEWSLLEWLAQSWQLEAVDADPAAGSDEA